MIPELGHFALILALCLAITQAVVPLIGSYTRTSSWMAASRSLAWGQFVFLGISLIILTNAFLSNDFSVIYVAQHGNTKLPDIYKISAVWGAHEVLCSFGPFSSQAGVLQLPFSVATCPSRWFPGYSP